jgi:hypothetical protein
MAGWTDIEKQKLRNLHAQGLTPAEMVDHFPGRTRNSIISRLRDMNLATRSTFLERGMAGRREGWRGEDTDLVIRLRCKWNWPPKSIAQALGKRPKAVYNILDKYTEWPAA